MTARFGFRQPAAPNCVGGDAGEVRLEIKNRSAVEHVEAANVKGSALAAKKLDDGESDGVGAARRAGGEDSVRAIIDGGRAQKFESVRAVEDP